MRYPLLRDPEAQADAANTTGRGVASRAAFAGAVLPSTAGCGRSDETGLNRRAVGAYSRDVRIPIAFVARKSSRIWLGGQCSLADGETEVVGGFATEQQAPSGSP